MRRADRLFSIVLELRRRDVVTAAQLAAHLEVSERTVYRDIADLAGAGVPVQGEAGVGYRLGRDFDLPPMMLDYDEVQALVLGIRMVESWGDSGLRRSARSALAKVEAVLPEDERHRVADTAMFAIDLRGEGAAPAEMAEVRRALERSRRLRIVYEDSDGGQTQRVIRPVGMHFWGGTWTVGGWCELREAHRTFRIDRIREAVALPDEFERQAPDTLADYLAAVQGDESNDAI